MSQITTTVMKREEARFDMVGTFLGYPLSVMNEVITQGLAERLTKYALNHLDDEGFLAAVDGWKVEVYTLDGDAKPADRTYCVRFINQKGGSIEVIGIFTKNGWPFLNHGLAIHHA